MILETAALVAILIRVGTDIGAVIENNIINAAIDAVTQKQQPSLTELGGSVSYLQREQRAMRADQRKQIEERYKTAKDLLDSARRTGKEEYRIELIRDASKAFIAAKNLESGEAAARAALLIGACHHLLYCIDHQYGIDNENHWYEEAFRLAEQSLGRDRKPPRDLIEQLIQLPYLSGKYGTFEVYWQKWEPPKRIKPPPKLLPSPQSFQLPWQKWEPPKRIKPPPKLLPSPQSFQLPRSNATDRPVPGIYQCSGCGKTFTPSLEQLLEQRHPQFIELGIPVPILFCPECWNNI